VFWKINKYSILIFALCFFVTGAILENGLLKKHPENHLIVDFEKQLHQNEKELQVLLQQMADLAKDENFEGDFAEVLNLNQPEINLVEEKGFGFLVYRSG